MGWVEQGGRKGGLVWLQQRQWRGAGCKMGWEQGHTSLEGSAPGWLCDAGQEA